MSDTIDKINPISSTTKASILRKTAYALPLRPSESGMSAEDIKKAFYSGMTDKEDSVMSELERVISEANNVLKNKQGNNLGSDNSNKVLVTNAQGAIEAVSADAVPTDNSNKPITSSGVYSYPAIKFAESERQKSKNLFNALDVKMVDVLSYNENTNTFTYTINEPLPSGDTTFEIIQFGYLDAGTYTVSFQSTSSVVDNENGYTEYIIGKLDQNGNYESAITQSDQLAGYNTITFTLTERLDVGMLWYYKRGWAAGDTPAGTKTLTNIQLEQGSVATDYQSYYGQISYTGDKEIEFAQEQYNKQKNLLDKTKFKTGCYIGTTGAFDGSNLKYKTTDPIDVKAGSTITVSCQNFTFTNESCFVFFKDGVFVGFSDGGKTTSTVPTNANQVIYNFYKNGITEDDVQYAQLEYGVIATEYQSYQGGEFVQENTLNEKVSTYSMMPSSNKVTNIYDFTTTGYHNYTAPANGYVTVFINLGTASPNDLWLQNQTVGLEITFPRVNNTSVYVPCKKGDTITFYTSEALTSQYNSSKFIYAED